MNEPQVVADYPSVCGENPLWHQEQQRIYWVDIPAGKLYWYDPRTRAHAQCLETEPIGGFTIQADGKLLLFMARGAIRLYDGSELTPVVDEIPEERDTRFNDVIADPKGRVFCGTMSTEDRPGRLYRLDTEGTLTTVIENVGCSNGMGFTPDRTRMYYTDSLKHEIYLFDYNETTAELTNRRVFASIPEAEGLPDGMTVDAEGFVWSARWDGSCIVRYAPDGTQVATVRFPVRKVSSVVFGGDRCEDLYVTTAGGDQRNTDGAAAGALFRLHPGVRGVPEFPSRVGI